MLIDSQRWYKPVKVAINAPGFAEVILDIVVCHHGLLDSVVADKGLLFTSTFWHRGAIVYASDTVFPPCSICKPTAKPRWPNSIR